METMGMELLAKSAPYAAQGSGDDDRIFHLGWER
jgi:hypothetical protein